MDSIAPLIYRTGSRVWEDIQQTKGTGNMKRTSSTTKMYILGNDEDGPGGNDDDDDGSEEEDSYSKTRNVLANRYNSKPTTPKEEDYNPLEHAPVDPDTVFRTGHDSSSSSSSEFDGDDDDNDDDEEYFEVSSFTPSRNKLIAAIDWLLGVDNDNNEFPTDAPASLPPHPHDREEVLRRRDEEQGLNVDVAVLLGTISSTV